MAREKKRCQYCGNKNLIEKYCMKWCTICAPGKLDLKIYEEKLENSQNESSNTSQVDDSDSDI